MSTHMSQQGVLYNMRRLWESMTIPGAWYPTLEAAAKRIHQHRAVYEAVAKAVNPGMPWWFVGLIHMRESTFNFSRHLHNGDPLTARTVRVPAGHPKAGKPPFAWNESAIDALTRFRRVVDWSLPNMLDQLERFNGLGYRNYQKKASPYLWNMSNHGYGLGKYVADGKYDPRAVDKQPGVASVLRVMVDLGIVNKKEVA